jgi:hypothetical protein
MEPNNHSMNIQIGGICCAITCEDDAVYDSLRHIYREYLTHLPADITVKLECTDRLTRDDFDPALISKTKFFHENSHFTTSNQMMSGQYDLAKHIINITLERSLLNPEFGFNNLNQLVSLAYYSACKVKYDGNPPVMLVHACGILRHGQALLFAGPSKAGKTTVAHLCRDGDGIVINDEMVLVSRPGYSGNSISVQSAPIMGGFPSRGDMSAPLRSILLLKKGDSTRTRPLSRTDAYLQFLRQIITPVYIGQRDSRAVYSLMAEFSDEITRAVPVYEFEFNLDSRAIWKAVDELEAVLEGNSENNGQPSDTGR